MAISKSPPLPLGRALFFTALFSLSAFLSYGDIVYLKNGRKMEAQVIKTTPDKVILKVVYGTITLHPNEIETVKSQSKNQYHATQARQLLANGVYNKAVEQFIKALGRGGNSGQLSEQLQSTYVKWAKHLVKKRQFSQATPVLTQALERFPDHEEFKALQKTIDEELTIINEFVNNAKQLISVKNYDRAIEILNEFTAEQPSESEVANPLIAQAWQGKGDEAFGKMLYVEAKGFYEKALAATPVSLPKYLIRYRYCLHSEAGLALKKGDLATANTIAETIIAVDSSYPFAWFIRGLFFESIRQQDQAIEAYQNTIVFSGQSPKSKLFLPLKKQAAELAKVNVLEAPAENNPFSQIDSAKWLTHDTPHFKLHFHNKKVGRLLRATVERQLVKLCSQFSMPLPSQKIPIYVYKDEADYRAVAGIPGWTGGITLSQIKNGKLDLKIATYQTSPRLTNGVIAHELVHAVLYINYPGAHAIPRAIHEGLATSQEQKIRTKFFKKIVRQHAKADTLFPLEDLLGAKSYPKDTQLFYAQSASLINYLIRKHGANSINLFLKNISTQGLAEALKTSYRIKRTDLLEKDWLKYVK